MAKDVIIKEKPRVIYIPKTSSHRGFDPCFEGTHYDFQLHEIDLSEWRLVSPSEDIKEGDIYPDPYKKGYYLTKCFGRSAAVWHYYRRVKESMYDYLTPDDLIEEGDEYFHTASGKWSPSGRDGELVGISRMNYRRKIK